MSRPNRETINLAVTVLREVVEMPAKDHRPSAAIRLALRVLLPHCPESWPLTQFWEGINGTHEIGRSQTITAAFNGIVRQLETSGAWKAR
jgi:hypothetical protein